MGAAAVGFVFAPSPRQMAPAAVADIVKRLPHETVTVGVFRDEAPRRVIEIANQIGLRGRAAPRRRVGRGHPVDRRAGSAAPSRPFPPATATSSASSEYGAQFLLIDGANPGSGELFDWRLAEGVVDPRPADRVGWAPARQRGRGHRPPPPVGRRRVQRGRGLARGQGPGQAPRSSSPPPTTRPGDGPAHRARDAGRRRPRPTAAGRSDHAGLFDWQNE